MLQIHGEYKWLCYISFHLINTYNLIFDSPTPLTFEISMLFFRRIFNRLIIFAIEINIKHCFASFLLSSLIYWIELICLCFKINSILHDMSMNVAIIGGGGRWLLLFCCKEMAKAFSFYNVLQFDIRRDPFLFRFFIWYLFRFVLLHTHTLSRAHPRFYFESGG